jgi:hypothetical protein
MAAVIEWLFRNRLTGELTIAQAPNAPLIVFLVAWASRRVIHPSGGVGTALTAVDIGALLFWAGDELFRGVNPWRRLLGAGVLTWEFARLLWP